MATRYDLLTAREDSKGKTWWTRVGVAFENQNRDGFSLSFEALPIPSLDRDGKMQVRVLMMVPRDRDDDRGERRSATPKVPEAPPIPWKDEDDDIPF